MCRSCAKQWGINVSVGNFNEGKVRKLFTLFYPPSLIPLIQPLCHAFELSDRFSHSTPRFSTLRHYVSLFFLLATMTQLTNDSEVNLVWCCTDFSNKGDSTVSVTSTCLNNDPREISVSWTERLQRNACGLSIYVSQPWSISE